MCNINNSSFAVFAYVVLVSLLFYPLNKIDYFKRVVLEGGVVFEAIYMCIISCALWSSPPIVVVLLLHLFF
jgi:hypothetical protein